MDPGHWKELDMVQAGNRQISSHTYVSKARPAAAIFLKGWFLSFHHGRRLHVPGNCPQNIIPKTPAIKKEQGGGMAWINEIHTMCTYIPTYVHILGEPQGF